MNVRTNVKPVKQKQRRFAPKRNKIISDEVDRLLANGMIKEVQYPDWFFNVVLVENKKGKWRVCIEFTNLTKACPKDNFPVLKINQMIDAIAGYERLSFLDAYSGYNQILLAEEDHEKTAFVTEGTYCFKVMPSGLKI